MQGETKNFLRRKSVSGTLHDANLALREKLSPEKVALRSRRADSNRTG